MLQYELDRERRGDSGYALARIDLGTAVRINLKSRSPCRHLMNTEGVVVKAVPPGESPAQCGIAVRYGRAPMTRFIVQTAPGCFSLRRVDQMVVVAW
jgi:hypothetical protein